MTRRWRAENWSDLSDAARSYAQNPEENTMQLQGETKSRNVYRCYGALILVAIVAVCWLRPPNKVIAERRGAFGLVEDMGLGGKTIPIRLAIYWGGALIISSAGVYQLITGKRVGLNNS